MFENNETYFADTLERYKILKYVIMSVRLMLSSLGSYI